jgi:hypothetical protein
MSVRPSSSVRLYSGTALGFESLAVADVGPKLVGTAASATTRSELARLWRRFRIPDPIPVINFDAYVVVAWVNEDGLCPTEVTRLDLTSDGRLLTPRLHNSCVLEGTYVHVIAIARVALPGDRFILVVANRFPDQPPSATKIVRLPRSLPTTPSAPPIAPTGWHSDEKARGSAALPPPGSVVGIVLDDGTPVWIVRHSDGGVDALAADDRLSVAGIEGVGLKVSWDSASRRFQSILRYQPRGRYDEYGVSVHGRYPPLDRYELQRIPDDPTHVHIGRRIAGTTSRLVTPPAGEDCRPPHDCLVDPPPTLAMSVGDAREAADNRVVLLDAALRLSSGTARLCYDQCPADAPVADGVRVPIKVDADFCGPVLVRIHGGRFSDIVLTKWGWSASRSVCVPPTTSH